MAASWGNVKLSPASAASMAVMFGAAVSASAFTPSYHLAARSLPCAARAPSLATRRCHPASRPVAGLSRRQGLKQGVGAVGMQVKPGTKDRDDMIVGLDVGGDDSTYSGSPDLDDKAVQQWTAESSLEIIDDTTPEGQARMAQKVKTRGILLMVAALYGTNFGSIKVMQEQLVPSDAALLRFTLALAALSPFLRTVPKEMWGPGIGIGVWVALGYVVQGVGLDSGSDASTAAFLCALAVVVCPLLDLLDGKPVSPKTWRAAALAVGGVGVLELGGGIQPSVGDLWSLLQPIGFGVGFWKIEKVMKDFPGMGKELTAVQLVVVWVTSVLWVAGDHFLKGGGSGAAADFAAVQAAMSNASVAASVVWTGLVTTALTVLLQTTSLGVLSSSETTVLYSTEPVWAAAFANLVLAEAVGPNTLVGGALIIAACISSAISPDKLRKMIFGIENSD